MKRIVLKWKRFVLSLAFLGENYPELNIAFRLSKAEVCVLVTFAWFSLYLGYTEALAEEEINIIGGFY